MKLKILLITLSLYLISCSKPSKLQEEFNCKISNFSNTEKVIDIKETFELTIPKSWKTSLYYDTVQTQIFTADTTKQLTETYILDFALNSGELVLNEDFKTTVLTNLKEESLLNLKYSFDTFKEKPSLWFISKGQKQNKDYYYFQLFCINSPIDYYEITTKIYGDQLIDERFCESLALIEKINFLK